MKTPPILDKFVDVILAHKVPARPKRKKKKKAKRAVTTDLGTLVGKAVERTEYQCLIFTDGTVLDWDNDGNPAVYTPEEVAAFNEKL